jgi:hypothetical protein
MMIIGVMMRKSTSRVLNGTTWSTYSESKVVMIMMMMMMMMDITNNEQDDDG